MAPGAPRLAAAAARLRAAQRGDVQCGHRLRKLGGGPGAEGGTMWRGGWEFEEYLIAKSFWGTLNSINYGLMCPRLTLDITRSHGFKGSFVGLLMGPGSVGAADKEEPGVKNKFG